MIPEWSSLWQWLGWLIFAAVIVVGGLEALAECIRAWRRK